jgi:hypothetical protein
MIQQSSAIWNDKYLGEFTVVFANILECESVAYSETTLTGESRFHTSTPLGIWTQVPCDGKQTGSPLDKWDMVRIKWDCRLSTGLPPSSRLIGCEAGRGDLQRAWNRERRAVWDQVGLSHCRHEGLVMVWNEARLRRDHRNDQSCRGHQCSETTLAGESRFHTSTPLGIWTQVPCERGSKRVVHWTSETWWESSEIAGAPQA